MRRLIEPFVVLFMLCLYVPAAGTAVILGGNGALGLAAVPAAAYLVLVGWLRWRRPDLRLPGTAEVRHCTTGELCRAWRRSDTLLRSVSNVPVRVRLVALRQSYLDALERRDPIGFALWVSLPRAGRVPPDSYIGAARRAVRED
ncbi:MAG TPA: hypothetical protein VFX70_00860 [Mycobacteriales bacterium]|nr:hypothetical protein [Mycobacteriales bacterium]